MNGFSRSLMRPACAAAGLLLAASVAGAQDTVSVRQRPADRICDMSMRVVTMQLVNRSGAPVGNAAVRVLRVRKRATVTGAESMGAGGDYKIIEDGVLRDLRPGGEPFDVTFAANGRRRKVRVIIGMDAGQCHVVQKAGPTKVTL